MAGSEHHVTEKPPLSTSDHWQVGMGAPVETDSIFFFQEKLWIYILW